MVQKTVLKVSINCLKCKQQLLKAVSALQGMISEYFSLGINQDRELPFIRLFKYCFFFVDNIHLLASKS